MLRANVYQLEARKYSDYPLGRIGLDDTNHIVNYLYPAMALAEEAGEVAGKYAKAIRDNGGVIDEERKLAIIKELGDVMWFVADLATNLNVSLEEVMQKNLDKLASRKARGVIHGDGDDR